MDALNEGNDCELAGVISGLGFAYTWYPGAPNDAIITDDNMVKRTFDALGYSISIYRDSDTHNTPKKHAKEFYKNQIISSVNKGFPVLGFGLQTVTRLPVQSSVTKTAPMFCTCVLIGTTMLPSTKKQGINAQRNGMTAVMV